MKIAIIGAGNAGCITALHYHYHTKNIIPPVEIEIYHSPERHPIERVGQGTVIPPTEVISQALGYSECNWYDNPIDATFKSGILYEGWGKKQEKIFHPFVWPNMAIHYVPQKLSNTVLESGLFKVEEKIVTDPEREIDSDVIFDCRGRNNRDKSNYDKLINPLNSVLLCDKLGKDPDLIYTRTVATPNGWTFIIPNKDSVSYGYLYNNNITTKEDATEDFIERFDIPEVDGEFSFENYCAKNFCVGERTFLNGNMYGFIEPLEATALGVYTHICRHAWDAIFNKSPISECSFAVRRMMKEVEAFILWHYQYGSKYDTPFWEYAQNLYFNPDQRFRRVLHDPDCELEYGQWKNWSFDIWRRGVE
jgi:tryptophan halogenase